VSQLKIEHVVRILETAYKLYDSENLGNMFRALMSAMETPQDRQRLEDLKNAKLCLDFEIERLKEERNK
jgi:hypothetical protein